MGRPFALDFGTIMQMGGALGADAALLAEVLPIAEAAIVNRIAEIAEEGSD